ncbi:uncharacterized protein [Amphiura filiformis]|uniref:uncharacterized protein n=1 Tax=Amphiura filiformis TaxID=82378 RepID=UPI003B21F935
MLTRHVSHKYGKFKSWRRERLRVHLSKKHIGELVNWEERQADRFIHREKLKKKEKTDNLSFSDMDKIVKLFNDNSTGGHNLSSRLCKLENQMKQATIALENLTHALHRGNEAVPPM